MNETEGTTHVDETMHEGADSPSLKEKINAINFVRWGKRAAITSGLIVVAAVVVSVVRDKTDNEG